MYLFDIYRLYYHRNRILQREKRVDLSISLPISQIKLVLNTTQLGPKSRPLEVRHKPNGDRTRSLEKCTFRSNKISQEGTEV